MLRTPEIKAAISIVREAHKQLQIVVQTQYPVGSLCNFRRSSRISPSIVRVVSHKNGTFLLLRNEITNKVYTINGITNRLERIEEWPLLKGIIN